MTRRERVREAIAHREPDVVPWQINFTRQEHERVAAWLGDPGFESTTGSHIEMLTFDAGFSREDPHRPGYFTDDFGVGWNRTGADRDIGVVDRVVLSEPELSGYRFPELDEAALRMRLEQLMGNGQDTFKIGRISPSLYERAWSLRGIENLLCDMIVNPAFVQELLEAICNFDLQVVDIGLSSGVEGFYFGDDWGQQRGLIMGPRAWRRFIRPHLARLYGRVKAAGGVVIQHSCGDNREILPDLVDIGLDVYQTLQPEIYDLPWVKREFGSHLSFWGGISTQRLLPFAGPEEVRRTAREALRIMGRGGGYIAGPTHWVPADVPPENVLALLEVFQGQDQRRCS